MSDFNNRLRYQKLIYLLQNYGVSLGYGYNWYVRGPYSPSLAKDLFTIEKNEEIFQMGRSIVFANSEAIDEEVKTFRATLEHKMDDAVFLEVLASLVFIKRSSPEMDNKFLHSELLNKKPRLKQTTNISAIMTEASGLISRFCD